MNMSMILQKNQLYCKYMDIFLQDQIITLKYIQNQHFSININNFYIIGLNKNFKRLDIMGTWEVTPSDGVTYNGNGEITFPTYTGNSFVTYTVKYTDDNGCTGQTNITQSACPTNNCEGKIDVYYGVSYSYDSQVDCNNWQFEPEFPYTDCHGDEAVFSFHLIWVAEHIDKIQSRLNNTVINVNGTNYDISVNKTQMTVEEYLSLVNTTYYVYIHNYDMQSSDSCSTSNLPNARVTVNYGDSDKTDWFPGKTALLLTFDVELIHV